MSKRHLPKLPLVFVLGLAVCWGIVIVVDMLNVGGLGEWVISRSEQRTSALHYLFTENRPVEWMQRFCLAATCIIAAQVSGLDQMRGRLKSSMFSLLMAILFAVMIIEDASNLRHNVQGVMSDVIEPIPQFWTFVVYGIYASIPLYAILRYGETVLNMRNITLLFWGGVLFYAFATLSSATAQEWYVAAGDILNQNLFGGRLAFGSESLPPEFWVMDSLIEETEELVGAICFLAYYTQYRTYID